MLQEADSKAGWLFWEACNIRARHENWPHGILHLGSRAEDPPWMQWITEVWSVAAANWGISMIDYALLREELSALFTVVDSCPNRSRRVRHEVLSQHEIILT